MADDLKFDITPEKAKYYAETIRKGGNVHVEGVNELVENLLNTFNGENVSTIVIALSIVHAIVDEKIQKDGTTISAQKGIDTATVVKMGVSVYKKRVEQLVRAN